ncbi:MAG: cupin domain-containing protein [Thermoplasmata archaeon]|nr:cupin domain-containing protein [Thermoplasmata archaeon]MCI4362445.1 cupin domain-containing protein [Thermoplasmata archaeon]
MSDRPTRPAAPKRAPALRETPVGSYSSTFAIAEYVEPPGVERKARTIAPLHRHLDEDEVWYVLEGELAVRLDGREVRATPGRAVWSPPNVVHTFWNPSKAPVRYLLIMGPKTHEFVETLHRRPPAGSDGVRRLSERCGIELME